VSVDVNRPEQEPEKEEERIYHAPTRPPQSS
jgi:hypothetical protein